MPYVEKLPSRRSILLLVLLFPLLYLPGLGLVELQPSEALLGTIGYEMADSRDPTHTRVHGNHVDAFPMYPWLVALCSGLDHPTEITTRLPAALCILAMALLSAYVAARAGGPLAGAVAAAMVLTNGASLRVGVRAQTETVFALWLSGGWFAWYRLGQERKRWNSAWLVACLCVFGGTWTAGARAIVYFYLPFFFMKRPVRGRQRLLLPSHLLGFGLLCVLILAWLTNVPDQPFLPWNALKEVPTVSGSYLRDLALFPLKSAIYLFPWTFLAWTPFCAAYRPLERRPVFFRYLRTLVFTAIAACWLLPKVSPLSLLPVLCPLAVMTGLHFEILVRRHRRQVMRLVRILGYGGLAASTLGLLLAALHLVDLICLRHLPSGSLVYSVVLLGLALTGGTWLRQHAAKRQPCWLQLTLAMAVLRLVWLGTVPPLKAWSNNERKAVGMALAEGLSPEARALNRYARMGMVLPPLQDEDSSTRRDPPIPTNANNPTTPDTDADKAQLAGTLAEAAAVTEAAAAEVIYRVLPNYHLTTCFYLGRRVVQVENVNRDLPPEAHLVYVLGGEKPPILPARTWTALTPPLDVRQGYTTDWNWLPRRYCLLEIRIVPEAAAESHQPRVLRMYRGRRR